MLRERLSRRAFLRGAGTVLALPYLESLTFGSGTRLGAPPTRICFVYVPNGMMMDSWTPARVGPLTADPLKATLLPLAHHAGSIAVVSGLHNSVSEKVPGVAESLGQHARSIGAFLTGSYPTRELHAGESIDVVLAKTFGRNARIPLLNLATEYARDQHDQKYSEVYNYSLSWKDAASPIQPYVSPDDVFKLLCSDVPTSREVQATVDESRKRQKSVLDSISAPLKEVLGKVDSNDRQSLEEFAESIRAVERQLEGRTPGASLERCSAYKAEAFKSPHSDDERLNLMFDLLHLAFHSGNTQVATYMLGAERSERDFGFLTSEAGIGMSGGHHGISHHKENQAEIERYVEINKYFVRHFARFLDKMKQTKEGDGTLLDRTFIVFGSSMGDGNTHEHSKLPILLAGKGNGLMDPGPQGIHLDYGGKPMANLFVTLLQKLSVTDPQGRSYSSFGNSGGSLKLPGGL